MATRKLYYEDCHLSDFTATVTGCAPEGAHWRITLDATAFYPEGGGQGCDLGTLGGVQVLSVRESGEEVFHLCDQPLAVGQTVTGCIDRLRRFDFMQQHTGEHILSGLLHQAFGCQNVGFHIGAEVMEVDFDCNLTWQQLMEIEAQANAVIWGNLPVNCYYPEEAALPNIPYRSKKALAYPVRLVEIPGIDCCACCGVHTATTGEVGLIKILSSVKFHQGVRMEMVCGQRAYEYISRLFDQAKQVSQTFSAKLPEIGEAAMRVSDALAAEKFRATALQNQLFDRVADSYVNQKEVVHITSALSGGELRTLAEKIQEKSGGLCAVFSGNDKNGYVFCLLHPGHDVRPLGKTLCDALHGKGGGKPEAWQGTLQAKQNDILAFFQE